MAALLISPTNGQREIFIRKYQTALYNDLSQNVMRLGKNNVSIKVNQEPLTFVVQCTTPEYKRDLQDFISRSMLATMDGGVSLQPMRLLWPSQQIDYRGYIQTNQLGAQRFEVGPMLSFTMVLMKDLINTITNDFSTGGDYAGIFEGQILDLEDYLPPDEPDPPGVGQGPGRGGPQAE